jgi:adenylate cyclase
MSKNINTEQQQVHNRLWEIYLTEGENALFGQMTPGIRGIFPVLQHRLYHVLPSDPRCLICQSPFEGVGGLVMNWMGKDRSRFNPSVCNACELLASKIPGGATVPVTMLFADIRGSTALAEKLPVHEFRDLIDRFFQVSADILTEELGYIDKLIGDEVSAFFVRGLAGDRHTAHAAQAGFRILEATGHGAGKTPWAPVGVGVHTGEAYVGVVGKSGGVLDLTVLGDVANTAARLASVAKAGELVLSDAAWELAEFDKTRGAQQQYMLKGKEQPFAARVVQA